MARNFVQRQHLKRKSTFQRIFQENSQEYSWKCHYFPEKTKNIPKNLLGKFPENIPGNAIIFREKPKIFLRIFLENFRKIFLKMLVFRKIFLEKFSKKIFCFQENSRKTPFFPGIFFIFRKFFRKIQVFSGK